MRTVRPCSRMSSRLSSSPPVGHPVPMPNARVDRTASEGSPIVRSVGGDFDGKICPHDWGEIPQGLAPAEWWEIDLEVQGGEIGSRECLVRQGALLRGDVDDMLAFVLARFPPLPAFAPVRAWGGAGGLE